MLYDFPLEYLKNKATEQIKFIFRIAFNLMLTISARAQGDTREFKIDVKDPNHDAGQHDHIHIADKNADRFAGMWIWKQNSKILKIKLKKDSYKFGSSDKATVMDNLKGGYIYTINGVEIANTISAEAITGSTEGSASKAYLQIYNYSTKNMSDYVITLINDNTIRFELSKRIRESHPNFSDLNIPLNVNLIKSN